MKKSTFACIALATAFLSTQLAAQTATQIPPQITTPDRVESRLGTLQFRDGFSVFVADRLEAVKWRNWKAVFYDEQRDWWSPPIKLGTPKAFDLITDPKEEYTATAAQRSWNAGPALQIVAEFEHSLKQYPPIAPGTPDPYTPPRSGQQ